MDKALAVRALVACLFLLVLGGCGRQQVAEVGHPSFLWEVEKGDTHAWLFGTMHLSDPRVTTLPLEVEQAFDAAHAVFTEVEATPTMAARMAQAGLLPDQESLPETLPAELYLQLNDYLASRSFQRGTFDRYRPWMVSLQLSQIDAIPFLKHGDALDIQLMKRARSEGKEYGAIETLEEQLTTITSGSRADHIHLLGVTLGKLQEEQATGVVGFRHLLDLYLSGDADALWQFALSETDFDDPIQVAWLQTLLTDRNLRMAQRIHQRLLEVPAKATFFAFGTLHFLGPESVVEHLRALGYQVTRVAHIPR